MTDADPKVTGSIRPDGRRRAIEPADVAGRFATARRATYVVLIAIYVLLPYWKIGGERAVFFDIASRRFFLFGLRFNAQDIWLTTFFLLCIGFALIFATTLLGRAWCGWACPQTVFLDGVYRRVERLILGTREQRLRRTQRWSAGRVVRTGLAHAIYAAISIGLAHIFISYFTTGWSYVALPIGALLYGNYAWFREQTCVVVCPYGRLQSVLLDDDSLVVGYDVGRGEPRGKVGAAGAGDCVDCKRCVAVCPTGIDIRDGLQLDCIACTACIDACDEVMVKVERPRGLIRYDSQRGLRGERRRILRPRVVVSALLFGLLILGTAFAARTRSEFEANLLRLPGLPFVVENGEVLNKYEVHLVNKRPTATTFSLVPDPAPGAHVIVAQDRVILEPFQDRHVPVIVEVETGRYVGPFRLTLHVRADGVAEERELSLPFLGPEVRR
jgi:cytochrome c oxidase accessory protein FixG